jgi:endonuclease III
MAVVPARPTSLKRRAAAVAARLAEAYPEAICELDHRNPFELLVATILSAQSTDARVNLVTPVLFERYATPAALAGADPSEVEQIVRSTGFYAAKTRNLLGMSNALLEQFAGVVPSGLDELVTLPGVGRKTANVVRAVAFGLPALPVDTHVKRLAYRLGLSESDDPAIVEQEVSGLLRRADWGPFGLRLILHGRRVCHAKRPACGTCTLADLCPSAVV